jgi:hypothetical protein
VPRHISSVSKKQFSSHSPVPRQPFFFFFFFWHFFSRSRLPHLGVVFVTGYRARQREGHHECNNGEQNAKEGHKARNELGWGGATGRAACNVKKTTQSVMSTGTTM